MIQKTADEINLDTELTKNSKLINWVKSVYELCTPKDVHWCDGSDEEYQKLCDILVQKGTFTKLNEEKRPNSYLCRTDEKDLNFDPKKVYLCTEKQENVGHTNNWASPSEMKEEVQETFEGSMKGRTMYVIPFSMGKIGSHFSKVGVAITDSPYVVIHSRVLVRIGKDVLDALGTYGEFYTGVHSLGAPLEEGEKDVPWPHNNEKSYMAIFPEEYSIWGYGSGFGSSAIAFCSPFSLRIASIMARNEGWLAEHMAVIGIKSPDGDKKYIASSLPDTQKKTRLATLCPPESYKDWEITTISDDVSWIKKGDDGKLYAINPQKGIYGNTSNVGGRYNKNIYQSLKKNTIFTNVALTDDGDVWWEGLTQEAPEHLIDWQGNDWHKGEEKSAAHPQGFYTSCIKNCPTLDENYSNLDGVPIDAIIFGGSTSSSLSLVCQAFNWTHGVYAGATIATEEKDGKKYRNPMSMTKYCAYNMADYFAHWLDIGRQVSYPPLIFYVNWYLKDENDEYIWPGFEEHIRILHWIKNRINGKSRAIESPLGLVPRYEEINWEGLDFDKEKFKKLFFVDKKELQQEVLEQKAHLRPYADMHKLPREFMHELGLFSLRIERSLKFWEMPD